MDNKTTITKYWPVLTSLLFLVATWAYWRFYCPAILVFKEQIQMFLFNGDYFMERIVFPAGLARYVAEFLVQFYNSVSLGALIVALLALLTQVLTWRVSRKENPDNSVAAYYLSFVPTLSLLYFLGNENVNLTFCVALVFALLAIWLYTLLYNTRTKGIAITLITPLLYWIAGPMALLFCGFVVVKELLVRHWLLSVWTLSLVVVCFAVSMFVVRAPAYRLFYGIGYTILITEFMNLQVIVPSLYLLVMLTAPYLKGTKKIKPATMHVTSLVVLALLFVFIVPKGVEEVRHEVLTYDSLVRTGQWNAIIQKAEKNNPRSPLTVASLNLALAMTGQLNERAGQFYQNGPQGAFPLFNKNFMFSLMTSEVYFNVGLVNTAQRYAFEAMETIPDNNKSARIVKRLAETNIINGQYDVARKYLHLLEQTMFYSKWAKRTELLLGDEEAITQHPLYGYMRQVRLQDDFIFSEAEIDKIMGQLLMHNPDNAIARQYLLLMPLLEGNQQKYRAYMEFVQNLKKNDQQQ